MTPYSTTGENGRQNGFGFAWLNATAETLELDGAEFEECLRSGHTFERVRASQFDGVERGINSTPSVFVNGVHVRAGGDYEAYRKAIEDALASAQQ